MVKQRRKLGRWDFQENVKKIKTYSVTIKLNMRGYASKCTQINYRNATYNKFLTLRGQFLFVICL